MKGIFKRIAATTLSLLVLLSTVSFTVNQHLCMGEVVAVAFFKNAKSCGMEGDSTTTDFTIKTDCCDTVSFSMERQENLNTSFFDLDLKHPPLIALFSNYSPKATTYLQKPANLFFRHAPPLINKDFQVLYATFLI